MNAGNLTASGHIEHIPHAQELLCAHFAQNSTAINFRCHLKRNPGWKVCLDRTGNHIHRRTLGRHNHVDTGSTCHLRQALNAGFDLFAGNHHQVGHFVYNHNDIGQLLGFKCFCFKDRIAGFIVETSLHGAFEILAIVQGRSDAGVISANIAHAHFGHFAIPVFHFPNGPFQRDNRFFRVRYHW